MSGMAGGLLIRACCRTGSLDQALTLLRENRQRRILLTIKGMESLLAALGEEKRIADMLLAHSFLEKRGQNGYNARLLSTMVKCVPLSRSALKDAHKTCFYCQVYGQAPGVRQSHGDHPTVPLQRRQGTRGMPVRISLCSSEPETVG